MGERREPRAQPTVTIGSLADLFSAEAKGFTVRKEAPAGDPTDAPAAKDWRQIALDFLRRPSDAAPLAEAQSFAQIDTARAAEFVAGRGSQHWAELRKEALDSAREKRRKARK
jgi:hypothetical protein